MSNPKGRQAALKGQLTSLQGQIDGHANKPLTPARVRHIKGKLTEYTAKIDEINEDVFAIALDDAAQKAQQTEYDIITAKILDLVDGIAALDIESPPGTPKPSSSGKNFGIRLPKIEIPTFSGNIQDWTSFYDLFVATIHKNIQLSKAQKLQYLKSSLKGDASAIIQALQITDANYDEAWDLLAERYNNRREIVQSHLKRLFSQPTIKEESAVALRRLIDTTNECTRALKVLDRPVDSWDDMLVFMVTERMDTESRRQWILSLKTDEPPEFQDIMKFLDQRARALAEAGCGSKHKAMVHTTLSKERKSTMTAHYGSMDRNNRDKAKISDNSCFGCKGNHALDKCSEFLKSTVTERKNFVRKHGLCFNCLRRGHNAINCTGGSCKSCKLRHHDLLHLENSGQSTVQIIEGDQKAFTSRYSDLEDMHQVLLATALARVTDIHGKPMTIRTLLDGGAQASFVSEGCMQKLGLAREKTRASISGLSGSAVGMVNGRVQLHLTSLVDKEFSLDFEAFVLPKVTNPLPNHRFKKENWTHLKNLRLADPTFFEPSSIDVLLGCDVMSELMKSGIRRGEKGTPMAQATVLGWVLSGRLESSMDSVNIYHVQCKLDLILQRFWELEELSGSRQLTQEEKLCELHFEATHKRDKFGRFVVKFPFRQSAPSLGSSREIAMRRWIQVERRLCKCPALKQQYRQFMYEYLDLGHMKIIPPEQLNCSSMYPVYLPHHAVLKESSSTTKLRVVFDASVKTSSGISLNETLMIGPKLQDDLLQILLRFRFHRIALCADVAKMYRQILVHSDDWDRQRILWRDDPGQPVQDYWLLTVTYGTASAPYQATKCAQKLAKEEESSFPLGSAVWLRDAYVDDLMSGANTQSEALELQSQLIAMLGRGGFNLRKWSSNDDALLCHLPPEMRETEVPLNFDTDKIVKTLGLHWNPARDIFSFSVCIPPVRPKVTKRTVLSDMGKVFDPLGWLSPVTIRAKILFQRLWKLKIDWDGDLDDVSVNNWISYRKELQELENIQIPRCIVPPNTSHFALHGFSDASEVAYSALIYLRCTTATGLVAVHLMVAKTKVAPLKTVSIPRLELCGALLLARLMDIVLKCMAVKIDEYWGWTDSTLVLNWLAASPNRWKTFVANRVTEIQNTIPASKWHHVRSGENPADCASRGIAPDELLTHHLWWCGPSWLSDPTIIFPVTPGTCHDNSIMEEKKSEVVAFMGVVEDLGLLNKYSSLMKLQRITAYCLRYIGNLKKKSDKRVTGFLSVTDHDSALKFWIRKIQGREYDAELQCLRKSEKENLPVKSRIGPLNPFIDEDGILRVGGRIQCAKVSNDRKHPILLPKNNQLTKLIIEYEHLRLFHAGPQLLLNSIQRRYWIINGRDIIRQHVRKCVICVRQRGETLKQMMGNLPATRVTIDRPFLTTGLDYAGPFQLKVLKGRGQKRFKAYIALFICFATKAIHLEAVSDLSAGGFIAALKRFVSRRGKCRDLFSDCGTNFIGANKELKEALQLTKSNDFNEMVSRYLSLEGINWHFNPPSAPHQGGLWEAGVKSTKYHLKRVVGNSVLDFEEFCTLLSQVEACLNSRPLCPISSDPNDLTALTPGHFLIGDSLTAIPEPSLMTVSIGRLARWQLVQQMVQHFWKRWTSEYLTRLQQRPKWWSYHPNVKVGDLVLVKDDRLPPLYWPLGRIIKVYPGPDELVRVVKVKTAHSEFKRPVAKICHLPIESSS